MDSYSAQYLADVVGARAYMAGKASHIAGVIATGDTLTIRLLAPAPDFLSRIAQPAFCAVPSNTPINGTRGVIPSAGPYYVASYTPGQGVVLARNPNYHGSRPHHFARIQLAVGIPARRAFAEIEAGTADYTDLASYSSTTIAARAARLAARYGPGSAAAARGRQQYFVNPGLQLDYFDLNTHRTLFSDVRVRQAVNYAINRRALARLGDSFQAVPERPTDHYLPPGMPGYRDAHVYPTTPNVAKARELIRQAHAAGRTAVLYTCDAYPCPQQAQIVKTDLAKIGLRVRITSLPSAKMFAQEETPGAPFDLAWDGWIPDYPDPEAMLNSILDDSSVGPTFKDPAYQRKLASGSAALRPRALPHIRQARPRSRPQRRAAGRVRQPDQTTTSSPLESAARPTGSTASTSPRSASGTPDTKRHKRPGAGRGRNRPGARRSHRRSVRQPSPPTAVAPHAAGVLPVRPVGKSPDAGRTLGRVPD